MNSPPQPVNCPPQVEPPPGRKRSKKDSTRAHVDYIEDTKDGPMLERYQFHTAVVPYLPEADVAQHYRYCTALYCTVLYQFHAARWCRTCRRLTWRSTTDTVLHCTALYCKLSGEARARRSCAIVSNSGELLHSGLGAEIDSREAVFRINYAPIEGFAPDVGAKTTFDVLNHHNAQVRACGGGQSRVGRGH
eukprot:7194899-Pyramimonas_sp.AAC.1